MGSLQHSQIWKPQQATLVEWFLNTVRPWLLVVMVSWMAGWVLVDYTLRLGAEASQQTLALVEMVPQRG